MDSIPRTTFSTDLVTADSRYDIFRDSISVLFDIEAHDKKNLDKFEAHLDAFMFDQIMLARTKSNAAQYVRSNKMISADGIDSIMVQLFVKGEVDFKSNDVRTGVTAGDIVIFDLARSVDNFNTDFDNLSALFPRELLESYLPTAGKWHGQVLPRNRPMTRLLRNHMLSLYQIGPEITNESCASIQRSLLDLTSSALQHSADILPATAETLPATVLMEIKKHIRLQLHNPELSPNTLCQAFGLSRAQLYRVTEPLGGISNYIRDLRLKRSFSDLQNPTLKHLSIAEIGYNWGFSDQGTYTRSFKKYFGLLPKDVREMGAMNQLITTTNKPSDVDRNYEDWVRKLAL
jgi:AraC-like DNA-binding protein